MFFLHHRQIIKRVPFNYIVTQLKISRNIIILYHISQLIAVFVMSEAGTECEWRSVP
jgi:hypothetical protein